MSTSHSYTDIDSLDHTSTNHKTPHKYLISVIFNILSVPIKKSVRTSKASSYFNQYHCNSSITHHHQHWCNLVQSSSSVNHYPNTEPAT